MSPELSKNLDEQLSNIESWLVVEPISKSVIKIIPSLSACKNHSVQRCKYYFPAGHHELKNKKNTGQIKFSAVTLK